jgi:precorrin-8X/cobalt-precorrin-8 methylmutase
VTDWNLKPEDIERQSFAIIDREAGDHGWPADEWSLVRRMIHTSADFEYQSTIRIHPQALAAGIEALRSGRRIVTDTRMAQSGLTARHLKPFGVAPECLIDHPDVIRQAKDQGATRALAAVDQALAMGPVGVFVVGNAPTALFRLIERVRAGARPPDLVVGLPVGFVNAAEAKDALAASPLVYITNVGRKGGSNVAAAVVNALAQLARPAPAP